MDAQIKAKFSKRHIVKLTKSYILNTYDQVDMFAKFLQIDRNVILDCIKYNSIILSPIREDILPSVGFRFNNKHKLKMRDFGGNGFHGDIFDLVASMFKIKITRNPNAKNEEEDKQKVKEGFMRVLELIDLSMYNDNFNVNVMDKYIIKKLIEIRNSKHVFKPIFRPFDKVDRAYWSPIIYGYRYDDYLRKCNIAAIDKLYINPHTVPYPVYESKRSDRAYVYYQGRDDKTGINDFKVYFINRTITSSFKTIKSYHKARIAKFLSNASKWQITPNVKSEWDVLLITKSYKDVISIKSFLDHLDLDLDIEVVAPPSEVYNIPKHFYDKLADNTREYISKDVKAIFSLYDYDYAGLTNSGKLKRNYNIHRLMFDKSFEEKDFTDNVKHYGKQYMLQVVIDTVKYIEQMIY